MRLLIGKSIKTSTKTFIKTLAIGAISVTLFACANTMQMASAIDAHKAFDDGKYEKTLVLITRAENAAELSSDMRARLTFLKANTYQKMGMNEKASTLYKFVANEHAKTEYGYLAKERLETSI